MEFAQLETGRTSSGAKQIQRQNQAAALMDILKHKDYEGTAEMDAARGVYRGKILFINDLVTYESPSLTGLQKEFELAVDDYLETCVRLCREPQAPGAQQDGQKK